MCQLDNGVLFNVYCNNGAKLLTAIAKNTFAAIDLCLLFAVFVNKLYGVHGAGANAFAAANTFAFVYIGLGTEEFCKVTAQKIGKLT